MSTTRGLPDPSEIRTSVRDFLAQLSAELRDLSLKIYNHPELSFQEHFAAATIRAYLETKAGVVVQDSKAKQETPTAFVATFEHLVGEEHEELVSVGFCSEYDALPIGHACGHNLICISGVAAFLTTAFLLRRFHLRGRLTLFGTPGEEGLGGKINMLRAGDFDGIHFAMMLHPGNIDLAYPTYLAAQSLDVEYFGCEAHASSAPWDGVNALDAMVCAFNAIAHVRQQLRPTDRVHGVITNGGAAPNIIPAYTSASMMVRALTIGGLKEEVKPKVVACLEGGGKAAGCEFKLAEHPTYYDVNTNPTLTSIYSSELATQLGISLPSPTDQRAISRGSTDMGNVTYACPGIHNVFDIGCAAEIHSVEFLEHAKSEMAHERTLQRVGCLVMVAVGVLTDKAVRDKARKEWEEERVRAVARGVEVRGWE
ncbi:hypothetical protein BCR44DRAFT_39611 [Catenaria anguillulae PL171]|uniref:Peptidase M20 domain-containing protein 2 n=1 Tax=Catenaria anguillulae PL171 TaxID=765915 RepID=A0A1Y2H7S8_9FUNG|nr:hypothetical protein BCR44DRAFT_39611 [Catenaria anguillulae PL171]